MMNNSKWTADIIGNLYYDGRKIMDFQPAEEAKQMSIILNQQRDRKQSHGGARKITNLTECAFS